MKKLNHETQTGYIMKILPKADYLVLEKLEIDYDNKRVSLGKVISYSNYIRGFRFTNGVHVLYETDQGIPIHLDNKEFIFVHINNVYGTVE